MGMTQLPTRSDLSKKPASLRVLRRVMISGGKRDSFRVRGTLPPSLATKKFLQVRRTPFVGPHLLAVLVALRQLFPKCRQFRPRDMSVHHAAGFAMHQVVIGVLFALLVFLPYVERPFGESRQSGLQCSQRCEAALKLLLQQSLDHFILFHYSHDDIL